MDAPIRTFRNRLNGVTTYEHGTIVGPDRWGTHHVVFCQTTYDAYTIAIDTDIATPADRLEARKRMTVWGAAPRSVAEHHLNRNLHKQPGLIPLAGYAFIKPLRHSDAQRRKLANMYTKPLRGK